MHATYHQRDWLNSVPMPVITTAEELSFVDEIRHQLAVLLLPPDHWPIPPESHWEWPDLDVA